LRLCGRDLHRTRSPTALTTAINSSTNDFANSAFAIGFFILDAIEPFHQHFSLDNKSLQYPYAVHERITIYQALLISLAAPVVIIAIYTLLIDGLFSHHKSMQTSSSGRRKLTGLYRFKDRLWELNCGILGLLLSQALAFIITQVLKNATGKPRPDLIDRCQPIPGSQDQPIWGLSNSTICTGDKTILKDGFRSWPSGHSSCKIDSSSSICYG
jgi:membrane-associated phospholipid phosphatase